MTQDVINNVYKCVEKYLPKKWKNLALYFLFSGNMVLRKFYVDEGAGFKDCFNMGYDKSTLRQIFYAIEDILYQEREKLSSTKRWNVFSLFVDSEGKFELNLEYDDVSETFIEHQEQWESVYINNN